MDDIWSRVATSTTVGYYRRASRNWLVNPNHRPGGDQQWQKALRAGPDRRAHRAAGSREDEERRPRLAIFNEGVEIVMSRKSSRRLSNPTDKTGKLSASTRPIALETPVTMAAIRRTSYRHGAGEIFAAVGAAGDGGGMAIVCKMGGL